MTLRISDNIVTKDLKKLMDATLRTFDREGIEDYSNFNHFAKRPPIVVEGRPRDSIVFMPRDIDGKDYQVIIYQYGENKVLTHWIERELSNREQHLFIRAPTLLGSLYKTQGRDSASGLITQSRHLRIDFEWVREELDRLARTL